MTEAKYCFFDWETRSDLDLTVTGTMRYVLDPSTVPLILSWGLNDGPIKLWCDDFSAVLHPKVWVYIMTRVWCYGRGKPRKNPAAGGPPFLGVPADIVDTAASPAGYFIASNVAFDRKVWQQIATPEFGFPDVPLEQFLDSQAQAQASNLPGSLDMAGRALNLGNKTVGGKTIMKVFADTANQIPGDKTVCLTDADVEKAINMWAVYLDYGAQDTDLMRDVWKCTRPLDAVEWSEYWASERINDRGILADLDVCRGAAAYREEEAAYVIEQIKDITNGQIAGPTFTAQINEWIFERLPDDLAEFMVKARDDEGYVTRLTGDKNIMTRLLEEIQTSDAPPEDAVTDLIETLQFGRSSSAVKFEKIVQQEVDGRLSGSYVFNGAGQTGRYCLAEDSRIMVRTLLGVIEERAIQELDPDEQVWDGDAWVEHEGLVCSGIKEVFEYDGVEATADHKVYISDTEYTTLRDAAERGIAIFQGARSCTQSTE